jgi:hypothetical protein
MMIADPAMIILRVKADKLLPVQSGGNIRTCRVLRYLSARHELTFYSYFGGTPDPDYGRELQRQLSGAVAVCTRRRFSEVLQSVAEKKSFAVRAIPARLAEKNA